MANGNSNWPAVQLHSERFRRPDLVDSGNSRINPNPKWVVDRWERMADKPFESVEAEVRRYRVFSGFASDESWEQKARSAYEAWRLDCQSTAKLYRACAYWAVAIELDQSFQKAKDFKDKKWDLIYGWDVIKLPPRSYLFVRMGYRWCGGDGHRHDFGDISTRLLARNPLDRNVVRAAVNELWDEASMGVPKPDKGELFERFILDKLKALEKTELWRPWDYYLFASVYRTRAFRTKRRSDLDEAVKYNDLAQKKSPKEFVGYDFQRTRDQLKREYRLMRT